MSDSGRLQAGRSRVERQLEEWQLCYRGYSPDDQPLREALTTLGNGHFATRGAAEEARAGGPHYPGTYVAGGYNRAESEIARKVIENEDLVNLPNWLPISFRCQGGNWLDLATVSLVEYEHSLDLYRGILSRRMRFVDRADREFLLSSRRIVHMGDPHVAAIEWVLTPINWQGQIEIRTAIDGRVTNSGVARYRDLNGNHLETVKRGATGEEAIFLAARTKQSHRVVAEVVRTRATVDGRPAAAERRTHEDENWVAQHLFLFCEAKKPVVVEKVLTLYDSQDFAISEPCDAACKHIHRAPDFAELLDEHELAWSMIWRRADLKLEDRESSAQSVLRLHLFHLLQTASKNTIGRDVGIPARGLHGEAYRGHIFWDELFTFPFLNFRMPQLTRALLLYRYRRLDEARAAAAAAGYSGAMFPWQSGSDGREESQVLHLNPESGNWVPDNTHRQRHVNAAIAYNIWQYHQATCDMEFLSFYGAEMLLEIARFWASVASYNAGRDRYEICGVVGPDEFHTQYPGTDSPGIDNNAYTNVMAAWVLKIARDAVGLLADARRKELLQDLRLSEGDLANWRVISQRMYVPFHGDGIISQFSGWDELEELDWEDLRERHGDIQRLDRILEADGDDPNRYKATKQADVLMLFFLFSAEELMELFDWLGYELDPGLIPRNIKYYMDRTTHGSTLSRTVHAWVLARSDRKRSWHLFCEALASDIDDIQGGTTAEGIHMGAMGGTVDLMQRCYTGLEVRCDVLWLNPRLPDGLDQLELSVRYRGHWLALCVTHDTLTVTFDRGWSAPAQVGFKGEVYPMQQGQTMSFELSERAEATS